MSRFLHPCAILLLSHTAAMADDSAVQATVRGVLVRSPGAFSDRIPFLEVTQEADGEDATVLYALDLPGDDYVRDAVAPFMDQPVVITGELRILPQGPQKDGSRKTGHRIEVQTLQLARTGAHLIGPVSPDGKWCAVQFKNGLKLYDLTENKGHLVYEPREAGAESAVDWSASATFSPDGTRVYTRQGLTDQLWSLPEVKAIPLRVKSDQESLVTLSLGGFSPDGRYLVMHGYRQPKLPGVLVVFRTADGTEIARQTFETPGLRKFSFLPGGNTLAVASEETLIVLSLKTGAVLSTIRRE